MIMTQKSLSRYSLVTTPRFWCKAQCWGYTNKMNKILSALQGEKLEKLYCWVYHIHEAWHHDSSSSWVNRCRMSGEDLEQNGAVRDLWGFASDVHHVKHSQHKTWDSFRDFKQCVYLKSLVYYWRMIWLLEVI